MTFTTTCVHDANIDILRLLPIVDYLAQNPTGPRGWRVRVQGLHAGGSSACHFYSLQSFNTVANMLTPPAGGDLKSSHERAEDTPLCDSAGTHSLAS